ncbi:hypothetical protein H072_1740 [Dactylellina haptotyla CBS 200.50]|uniref:Uncharacterized protein n=1 Tax=Dactylellina haptotyla (strain CBS 200.50) TaxID=1284197 RepID=S8C963_DACHA|nr:hypothetical protein H072_1740 [Dactylellina haptotyla CBS 200.50]
MTFDFETASSEGAGKPSSAVDFGAGFSTIDIETIAGSTSTVSSSIPSLTSRPNTRPTESSNPSDLLKFPSLLSSLISEITEPTTSSSSRAAQPTLNLGPSIITAPVMVPYRPTAAISSSTSSPLPTNISMAGSDTVVNTPTPTPEQAKPARVNVGVAIGIAIGCLAFLLFVGIGIAFFLKRRKRLARQSAQSKGLRELKLVMAYDEQQTNISDSWSSAPVSAISNPGHDLEGYGRPPMYTQPTPSETGSTVRLPLSR